ncbi:MAG: hypothetical protein NVS3B20_23440 [Polyangiales bacterium]
MHSSSEARNVRRVMDAFRQIVQALRVSSKAAEMHTGISGAQLFVLQTLAEAGSQSVNELAARTATHQSSVSVVVRRLVDEKLVVSRRSKADRRRLEVSLTRRGRSLLSASPNMAQARLVQALHGLTSQRVRALARDLDALLPAMGVAAEIPPLFFEDQVASSGLGAVRATSARTPLDPPKISPTGRRTISKKDAPRARR